MPKRESAPKGAAIATVASPLLVQTTVSRQLNCACEEAAWTRCRTLRICTHRQKLLAILGGQLVNQGRDHAAGAAPRGPKVHQHRHLGLEHLHLECRVRHHARVLGPCSEETQDVSVLRRRLISRGMVCTGHRAPTDGCCCCCSADSPPLTAQAAATACQVHAHLPCQRRHAQTTPTCTRLGSCAPEVDHKAGDACNTCCAVSWHRPQHYRTTLLRDMSVETVHIGKLSCSDGPGPGW